MYCKPRQQAYIRLYNNCLRDRATNCPDLVVGLHLCRGTEHPSHLLAKHLVDDSRKIGNFRYIYPFLGVKLFNEINVGTYYLGTTPRERDTLRPSSISPRTSPSSFSYPELEYIDELQKRVHEAAKIIASGSEETEDEAMKRICVSPQCE